jgi:hypothetical protein
VAPELHAAMAIAEAATTAASFRFCMLLLLRCARVIR